MRLFSALDDNRLRLAEMLERHGTRLADQAPYWAGVATRRCVLFCSAKDECDAWLASGRRDGYARFCPNAAYVASRSRVEE